MRENSEMMRALPQKKQTTLLQKDGFISIGFGNINAILIFASSGIECCFRKNSLLANCFQVDKTVWF